MNLYEAVSRRRSIRKFKKEAVSEQMVTKIIMFSHRAVPLDPSIRVKAEILDNRKGQVPAKGLGKVDAPYYLLLYSEEKKGFELNAGYLLEQIVLYMAARGLGSCYLGGTRVLAPEPEGLRKVMVLAFGYPRGLLYRDPATAKRLPLKELCVYKEEVDEGMKAVLKAARLAPSAMNSQPWRFVVYQDRICIFSCREYLPSAWFAAMREFSVGVMLSHLMLAAEEAWMDMRLVVEEQMARKTFKSGEYVATAVFRPW